MAKTWVLETSTKGTGANIVPLEEREAPDRGRERAREALWVHKPTRPRPAPEPEPRRPHRFRVVEVTTHRVLAEDADARATIAVLRDVHSIVDVAISVWSEKDGRYRLLTHGEQKTLWDLRDAQPRPAAGAGSPGGPS
jgi:hypothetical protein